MPEPQRRPIRVLFVEDSPDDAALIERELKRAGLEPAGERVDTEPAYLAALDPALDVILADFSLPGFSAPRALELLKARDIDVPFIVVSGSIGEEMAVRALQSGAADYLLKDRLGRLGLAVTRAIEDRRRQRERRTLEDQYRQSQKMQAIGLLAGGVAHDFNNLLTAIQGYCELLSRALGPTSEHQGDLGEIRDAADRATALTRQLLAFSRQQTLEPHVLDLRESLDSLQPMLKRLIGEHIDIVLRPGAIGHVRADPGQVEQVLLNLALNARDAMPDGGTLILELADIVLDESYTREHADATPGRHVMLAVTDTGTGMDAATVARIFDPFFTTKPKGQGTGLGLSTVYGIVKQSGGHVDVYTEPGRGTTFKVYLPRVDDPVDARVAQPEPPSLGGCETILVAEDEAGVHRLVQRVLDEHGYEVLLATTPEQAVSLATDYAGSIDLLLSDVVLPHMSGRVLADQIRAIRPGIAILYMSGYTDNTIAQLGVLEAGTPFIQKPFSPGGLARKIRAVLDTRTHAG
jgi:signal transduction histidine kinase